MGIDSSVTDVIYDLKVTTSLVMETIYASIVQHSCTTYIVFIYYDMCYDVMII